MTPKDDVSISYLREIFDYDPERGLLLHKKRPHVKAGTAAGHIKTDGYMAVKVHQKGYYVHRIIWAMMTGSWPEDQIDHINLDKADNRWVNLREATHSTNKANIRAVRIGLKGVCHATKNRWRAVCGGKHIGYFLTEEAANAAYVEAAKRLYGEFASLMAAPEFILILTMVTAGHNTPDIVQRVPMDTLEECWSQAKEFTAHGVPKLAHEHGVVGVVGACFSRKPAEDDDT